MSHDATTLDASSSPIAAAAKQYGAAVVGVGRGWRPATGVVIAAGRVLTTARAAGPESAAVSFADGREVGAKTLGLDRDLGVAVLGVDTGEISEPEWAPAEAEPGIGDPVVALANPGGRGLRATLGFVAAAERSFRGPRGRRVGGAIEHTAPLPRGSAGGPLLDSEGRLVGLNMLRLEGGLILALGIGSGLRDTAERLGRGERRERPRLGIAVAPAWVTRKMLRAVGLPERDGVLIRAVEEGSPADRAGLEQGDLIVAAAGASVDGVDALHAAVDAAPNGEVTLGVVRGGEEREVRVALAGGGR